MYAFFMEQQQLKAKLLWRCRRGMKELDVVMVRFVEESYFQIANDYQAAFEKTLAMQDPDLYALVLGRDTHNDPDIQYVINILSSYRPQ